MADELPALNEFTRANHKDVLTAILVPAVNGPRQLAGVVALGAMPVLLRALHPLRTEGTLEDLCIVQEVEPHVLHVLVCVFSRCTVFLENYLKLYEELVNGLEFGLSLCVHQPLAGVNQLLRKDFR